MAVAPKYINNTCNISITDFWECLIDTYSGSKRAFTECYVTYVLSYPERCIKRNYIRCIKGALYRINGVIKVLGVYRR